MLLWAKLEQHYLNSPRSSVENGRFLRNLRFDPVFEREPERLSESVNNYVNHFDRALKMYFEYLNHPAMAARLVEEVLREYAAGELKGV
jgi:hypothetical protein